MNVLTPRESVVFPMAELQREIEWQVLADFLTWLPDQGACPVNELDEQIELKGAAMLVRRFLEREE